ncbi:hypothetical protein Tco_0189649 [Tanacetum coccineum]
MIQMIKSFDREYLETLWKLVKAKHGYTKAEEGYERVLWGDLKTMFEHNIKDTVWRNLHGNKVLTWKLFDSYGVHFVRFQDMHIFILVEKRYPLTPQVLLYHQINNSQQIASKLQAEFDKEVRLAREKAKKEEEANIVSWDNVQAIINDDYQMAQQMQAKEQDKLSIEEKSKLFIQHVDGRDVEQKAVRKSRRSLLRAGEELEQESSKKQKVVVLNPEKVVLLLVGFLCGSVVGTRSRRRKGGGDDYDDGCNSHGVLRAFSDGGDGGVAFVLGRCGAWRRVV